MAPHKIIPAEKSRALFAVINILVPGSGDIYLGPPWRAGGVAQLVGFLLAFPLILAFGIGLLLLALAWLTAIGTTLMTLWRTAAVRRGSVERV